MFLRKTDAEGGQRWFDESCIDFEVQSNEHRCDRRVDIVVGPAVPFPQSFGEHLERRAFVAHLTHGEGEVAFVKGVDVSAIRMVFTNEIGLQYFDFEFSDGRFIVHSIFPAMNRKGLLTILEKDFRLVLFHHKEIKKVAVIKPENKGTKNYRVRNGMGIFIYSVDTTSNKVSRIVTRRKLISKTTLSITYPPEGIPDHISIINPTLKLHINILLISN